MKALIIGATGATGKDLVTQILSDEQFEEIHVFVRQDVNIQHDKLNVHIVDFDKIEAWKADLQGDVLFSALGTTIKQLFPAPRMVIQRCSRHRHNHLSLYCWTSSRVLPAS